MSNFEIIPVSSASTLDISPASNELSILDSFEALEFEFDDAVDKASRLDYAVAAGSGLLTGLLSVFLGKPRERKNNRAGTRKLPDFSHSLREKSGSFPISLRR